MYRNYLKTALRNLWRNKGTTFINVFGMSVALAVGIIIFLYVRNELRHDQFHVEKDRVHRVLRVPELNAGESATITPMTSGTYGPHLQLEYPDEVQESVRVMLTWTGEAVKYQDITYKEKGVAFVDSTFFRVFSYKLKEGDPETVLNQPQNMVLTERAAKKYFGTEDPIGKTMRVDDRWDFIVAGILEDIPEYSHLDLDFLLPFANVARFSWVMEWWNNNMFTYVMLHPKVDAKVFEAKLSGFMDRHFGDDFEEMGRRIDLQLQPLTQVYFDNFTKYDNARHGDKRSLYLFGIIAVFIMGIACINFMNLATARSMLRAKEVGIRKTVGANRQQLIVQFLGESMLLVLGAVVIGLVLVELSLPYFNSLFDLVLAVNYESMVLPLSVLGLVVVVGLAAGSYPALFLSSFQPAQTLKGKMVMNTGNISLRKVLVVIQFSLSILLIIGTIVIYNQLQFIQDKKLGYNKEQVIMIPFDNRDIDKNRDRFKERLLQNPNIVHASMMSGVPGGFHDQYEIHVDGKKDEDWVTRTVFCDGDMLETLGLELLAGRDFDLKEYGSDLTDAAMINETTLKKLGWTAEEAIGKSLSINMRDTMPRKIVGIVKDYNFLSLKEKVEPLVMSTDTDYRLIAIKANTNDLQSTIRDIEEIWGEFAANYPFDYQFLDVIYEELYETEQQQQAMMQFFAFLAILIACLGLFALSTFTAERRTKEIGIRKVLGATVSDVVLLLSKEFGALILVAFMIAIPVSYYVMYEWLNDFEYHVNIGLGTFVLAGILMLVFAWLTVGYQSVKAGIGNPVKALRYE
ncbi:MAG: ABC transporter permease [Chitinophagales bacterium]